MRMYNVFCIYMEQIFDGCAMARLKYKFWLAELSSTIIERLITVIR